MVMAALDLVALGNVTQTEFGIVSLCICVTLFKVAKARAATVNITCSVWGTFHLCKCHFTERLVAFVAYKVKVVVFVNVYCM
jgi:hypothetical protein